MNSNFLKLLIAVCLVFQMGCAIKFKRKAPPPEDNQLEVTEYQNKLGSKIREKEDLKEDPKDSGLLFSKRDSQIIASYYADEANAIIRKDMVTHTKISKKQQDNLQVNKSIARDIQVMPLPLRLEKRLSALSLNLLRVQVGSHVVLMNVKSRQILDIIKI